jgi:hypothetical protein
MSYDGWSKQELQEECTRRGLKMTGTKAVLVERLETNDELRAVKAAVSHKRKAVSEEEQDALDEQLLGACKGGSLEAVRAALSSGANSSCVDEDLCSPLIWACNREDDWAVAEDIVRELLSCGAAVNTCDDEGCIAILYAAWFSSSAVVTLLLEAKSRVDPRSKRNNTPLLVIHVTRTTTPPSLVAAGVPMRRLRRLHVFCSIMELRLSIEGNCRGLHSWKHQY